MSRLHPQQRHARTLGFRLSLVMAIVMVGIVTVLSVVGGWRSFDREVASKRELIAGAASAYAAALSEPLAQGDRPGAKRALRGVRDLPGVLHVTVETSDGPAFLQLGSSAMLVDRNLDPEGMSTAELWAARQIRVKVPIVNSGRPVGTIAILSDISDLRANIQAAFGKTAIIAISTITAGLLMMQIVITRMTRPLRQLTASMAAFADDQASPLPAIEASDQETGILANAYNQMIESIRARDARIARQVETLEDTVDARTHELRLARDEAEAANAAKSDFLATMSHEIRTPMNGMLVMAEVLGTADLPVKERRYAEIISRSGKRLLTIINDILDLSKIEAGKLELEMESLSTDMLVNDVVSLFRERAESRGLELVCHIGQDVPETIFGDPTRLGQVLTNLVNNALKFTDTGAVRLVMSLAGLTDAGAARLRITVEDTGIGIPQDKLDTIFEAFSQGESSTNRRYGGTGLGLAICKRLVMAMGGEISAASVPGEGSCFTVTLEAEIDQSAPAGIDHPIDIAIRLELPEARQMLDRAICEQDCRIVPLEAAELIIAGVKEASKLPPHDAPVLVLAQLGEDVSQLVEEGLACDVAFRPQTRREFTNALICAFRGGSHLRAPTGVAPERPRQTGLAGLHVLAAEDDLINREVLGEVLGQLAIAVTFAEDGMEAVSLAAQGAFDAILMDGSMPVMDGFEATRRIRAYEADVGTRRVPIIALTAQVAGTDNDAWERAGADAHLTKPFTLDSLSGALAALADAALRPADDDEAMKSGQTFCAVADASPVFDTDTLGNMDALGSRAGRNIRQKIWDLFVVRAPDAMSEIESLLGAGADAETIASKAHAFKSMALSAGTARLAEGLKRLEQVAAGGGSSSDIRAATDICRTSLAQTLDAIATHEEQPARDLASA